MNGPRRDNKWWGWGDPERGPELSAEAIALLRARLGHLMPAGRPATPQEVGLPDPRPLPAQVLAAVGDANVYVGSEDRLRHAAGKGYADLIRVRSGRLERAPDAVLVPDSDDEVAAVLDACSSSGVAVVPFGGGTSVVGGIEPIAAEHSALISLDLAQLRNVEVDRRSMIATLGAGLRGPEAERELALHGVTLGHFPQSFEYATIGGFAATRSAGQASSGYGRFDDLVSSLQLLAPAGRLRTLETPHTAAGPSLRQLVLGSEGVLGVIPEVSVRVRALPEAHRYEAWIAESFDAGADLVRSLAQAGELPDVIRVSDEQETEISLALSGTAGAARAILERYLALRGKRGGCLLVVGIEGEREAVARRRSLIARRLRSGGAVYLGQRPGRAWQRGRYQGPYFRDTLIDAGALVETLESAHTWRGLGELYRVVSSAIRDSLAAQGTPGIVFCHLSHAYPDGASLYFTFIARQRRDAELEQWRAVKAAACAAITGVGATITHHHAVGRDHARYMAAEVGETGVDLLRALKAQLDPAGVLNPGKLVG